MLLLLAAHTGLNVYASARVNRALEAARAKGDALTLPELAPPAVPDVRNAALLYAAADRALPFVKVKNGNDENRLLTLGELDKPMDEGALAILASSQKAVELARAASERPGCSFPVNWNQQPASGILFPHYAMMRRLARLMSTQAVVKARRGDTVGALRDARAIFAMSAHLKDEPILIGFLVSRAIHAIGNRAVARVLEVAPASAAQGRAFEASLPSHDWSASFRHAMLGERAFGMSTYDMMRRDPAVAQAIYATYASGYESYQQPSPLALALMRSLGWLAGPFLKLDQAEMLRLWEMQIQNVSPMPVPMPPARTNAIQKAVDDLPRWAVTSKIMFPVFERAHQNRERATVEDGQRQAALALSAFRHVRGRYPLSLAEAEAVAGALPMDLYSEQPLRYGSDGRTFFLYSVGPNRRDDRGVDAAGYDLNAARTGKASGNTDDLVWNPKPRR